MKLSTQRALRVAFDTTGIYVTQAGIARYVRGLQRGMEQVAPNDVELFPLAWEVENFGYQQPWRMMRTAYRELLWGKMIAPRVMNQRHTDVFHATSSLFMRVPPHVKHVITLHDLSCSRHPERFRSWQIRAWNRRLPVLRQADRIITISKFTADEAIRLLDLPAERMEVVHNGCDFHPDEPAPREAPPKDVELPSEFFFFLGSLEPGKNLSLLRQAYLSAEAEGVTLPPLVIIGARWEGVPGEGGHPKNWIYLGRQDDEVVVYAYRRAIALVFPAIYEGFGLPVIEAMSLGCPVICSPVSALPEVAGDAAMMVDPQTPDGYRAAMLRLSSDASARDELIARGRAQCRAFSWKRCAEQVLDVYRQVAG